MPQYANKTSVPVEKSRAEIETILTRYGADRFGYATDSERGLATIQFEASGRHIRFVLQLPRKSDKDVLRCADCSLPYSRFPDLVIEDWAWLKISPRNGGGGVLCPTCICRRLELVGISCRGALTSGSLISVSEDRLAEILKQERNRTAHTSTPESQDG